MPYQAKPFHHAKFVDCLRKLFYGPVPPTLTKWPPKANSVGAKYFGSHLTEDVVAVCAAYVRMLTGVN